MARTALFEETAGDVELRCKLVRVYFAENGYLIAQARGPDGKITVKGNMLEPVEGQEYILTGRVKPNDRYGGLMLEFSTYRSIMPEGKVGIWTYLVEHAKWVGPSIANALLDAYGEDVLRVIKDDPERVAREIDLITPERAAEMANTLKANERLEAAQIEINQLLGGHLGPATVKKALKRWGADAAHLLRRRPYRLLELFGVGWRGADGVAMKLGLAPDARLRHAHAVLTAASELTRGQGDTRLRLAEIRAYATKLLHMPVRDDAIELCRRAKRLLLLDETDAAYASYNEAERAIAANLMARLAFEGHPAEMYPEINTDGLAADQIRAVQALADTPVGILCGAPGTGKTYTVARIISALRTTGAKIALAAPTGKAAKQLTRALSEVCGGAASTIHRLLEPTVDEDGQFSFARNRHNQLDCDVLVLDECSMIDVSLMRTALEATPLTTRVIFVGDHYQLPSIGPGAVLRDLLQAGIPSAELREIKRNAGRIVRACHEIKDGRVPAPSPSGADDPLENWLHIDADSPEQVEAAVCLTLEDMRNFGEFDELWDVQLISPVNEKGPLSCLRLNNLAREIVNPGCTPLEKLPFWLGDKIVRLRNAEVPAVRQEGVSEGGGMTYIVNGDIGQVYDVNKREIIVDFKWPDRRVILKVGDHHLKPAYCLTGHKLQGSETPVAIVPLYRGWGGMPLWTREWIYTTFSRAKGALITVGNLSVLGPGIARVGAAARRTDLATRIRSMRSIAELL